MVDRGAAPHMDVHPAHMPGSRRSAVPGRRGNYPRAV